MKLNRSFVIALAVVGLACGQSGGKTQDHATVTVAPKPDASTGLPIVIPKDPTAAPSDGTGVVEAYGTPQPDAGQTTTSQPDAAASDAPSITKCVPNTFSECPDIICPDGKTAIKVCSDDGSYIQFGGETDEICACRNYDDDAGIAVPPTATPDAGRPDLAIVIQPDARLAPDASRPDVSPDLSSKPDALIKADTLVPVFVPQPDASLPDTRPRPDASAPDTQIVVVTAPDLAPELGPDVTPDTTPDTITIDVMSNPDLQPIPPVCTADSPTNVISITLAQSGWCSLTVTWKTSGCSSKGYKIIWSKNPGPTYPTRVGDSYQYLSDYASDQWELTGLSPETYYVRVCQDIGNACGVYSNEVAIVVN